MMEVGDWVPFSRMRATAWKTAQSGGGGIKGGGLLLDISRLKAIIIERSGRNTQLESYECQVWAETQEWGILRIHRPQKQQLRLTECPSSEREQRHKRAEGSGGNAYVREAGQREA